MNNVTLESYPDLRDLTRNIGEDLRTRIGGYIEMVKPHFRPGTVFGPYLSSTSKSSAPPENPKTSAAAFAHFTASFKEFAVKAPLNLDPTLPDMIEINYATPVLHSFTYSRSIASAQGPKRLTVTAPFRFVLAFPEYSFSDLRSLVRSGPKDKLREFALHYAALNYVVMQNKRLLSLFEDLRFPVRSEFVEELGLLPITTIAAPGASALPPDAFVALICKFTGADTAEELVDLDSWSRLPDPLADRFREEAAKFAVSAEVPG